MTENAGGATKVRTDPIRLDFEDGDRLVVVSPEDNDRYAITVQDAINALSQQNRSFDWRKDFETFCLDVHKWCCAHKKDVFSAFVSLADGRLRVFIVGSEIAYNFELDDDITELDLLLHDKYKDHPTDVIQLPLAPNDKLMSFIDLPSAMQVYA